jgi:glycosyltransferase involved in cell wall biosynthesis
MISVVLPVFNGAQFIDQAISSILEQTYPTFELVIVDDGSTDGTWEIIRKFSDPRIAAIRHETNLGLVPALRTGIAQSTGDWIARHDADDLSASTRFQEQVDYIAIHPDVHLLGTWANVINDSGGSDGLTTRRLHHPVEHVAIRWALLWNSAFVHGSVMIRRSTLEALGGYSSESTVVPAEDYDLWSRLAERWKTHNLPRELLAYRQTAGGMSATRTQEMASNAEGVSLRGIENLLRRPPGPIGLKTVRAMNGIAPEGANFLTYLRIDAFLTMLAFRFAHCERHAIIIPLGRALARCHRTQAVHLLRRRRTRM